MITTFSLGSVVDVSAGQPAPKSNEFAEDGLPFIRAGSLENLLNGGTLADCEKLPQSTANRKRFRVYPKDTIVFAKSGMSATLGRVYRLPEPAHVVSHLAALVPTGNYDPGFLTHWLRKHPPSHLIKDPAYPSIRVRDIAEVEVPAVPLDQQRRIAEILDKADAIRRKRELALETSVDLLKSIFWKSFFGPEANWPLQPLRTVSELINGDRSSNYPSGKDLVDNGILFFSTKNISGSSLIFNEKVFITEEKFASLTRGKLQRGDLIMTLRGSIGQCAVFDCEYDTGFINAQLMIIRPRSNVTSNFLHSLLIHPMIQHQLMRTRSGSAVPQLTAKRIGDLEIPIPPIEAQKDFDNSVRQIQVAYEKARMATNAAKELCASLSDCAFRGEL